MRQTIKLEAEFFFQQGLRQLQAEKFEAAISSLDNALKCKPDYTDALSQRGFALGNLGRHEKRSLLLKTLWQFSQTPPGFGSTGESP
jgi:Flp pilus assembly protein TadD